MNDMTGKHIDGAASGERGSPRAGRLPGIPAALLALAGAVLSPAARAAGFALYEMSAKASATGGGVVGKPADASANFFNPAGLSSLTGTVVTVTGTVLRPTADTRVNGRGSGKMDSGHVFVPAAFVSQELPWGFAFGLGAYADWGLRSHYGGNWPLAWDSQKTEFVGYTVNPNVSYRITDDWSVGAGVRLVHATFVQHRNLPVDLSALGLGARTMHMKFDVDNDVDVGYQVGTQYRVTDTFSVGAVWKSRVRLDFEGDSRVRGVPGSVATPAGRKAVGDAYAGEVSDKLDLPMSASVGFNWDVTPDLHVGSAVTWTEWSSIDEINFTLPSGRQTMDLRWRDAWRFGVGAAYDLTRDVSVLAGYVYDIDPTDGDRYATMLPEGDRHCLALGAGWRFGRWELSGCYFLVLQEDSKGRFEANGRSYEFRSDNALSHGVALTVTCRF